MNKFEKNESENIVKKETVSEKDLGQKILKSINIINRSINMSNNQVALVSFGKDSLVMYHLIKQIKKLPVIYWREPFFQSKFKHVQEIAEKWDLTVYDYPPSIVDFIQLEDYFDVYNFYYVNGKDYINLFTGTRKYKETDKEYLCAVVDLLNRPKVPAYEFKFDCVFHGQKQSDPIYISDTPNELPEMKVFGNGIISYPLKDWADADIWAYIKKHDLPYNKERYDNKNEKNNNDLFPTCHDCLDYRNNGKKIHCKKYNKDIDVCTLPKSRHEQFRDQLLNKAV